VRRLKRAKPKLRVGVFSPKLDGDDGPTILADAINADFVAASIVEAVTSGLADKKAVPLKATSGRLSRKRTRPKAPVTAKA
jgi:hypothetical protein